VLAIGSVYLEREPYSHAQQDIATKAFVSKRYLTTVKVPPETDGKYWLHWPESWLKKINKLLTNASKYEIIYIETMAKGAKEWMKS
jgi:hypothetical protein